MKFINKNLKVIIGFIVGVILASGITVYAYSYASKDISYTKKLEDGTETEISVEEALNELYDIKTSNSILGKPFHTITSSGTTYTAPRDCILYIYTHWNSQGYAAYVYLNGNSDENFIFTEDGLCLGVSGSTGKRSHIMEIKEGDVISTRSGVSGLTYLLEFYDYK